MAADLLMRPSRRLSPSSIAVLNCSYIRSTISPVVPMPRARWPCVSHWAAVSSMARVRIPILSSPQPRRIWMDWTNCTRNPSVRIRKY